MTASVPYTTRNQFVWTLWGLRLQITLAFPLIIVRLLQILALIQTGNLIREGGRPDLGTVDRLDNMILWLARTDLTALLITGVAFLIWWHHSVVNVKASGQHIYVSPGWSVGMWFTPFANLYLPMSVMKELAASHLDARRDNRITIWWVCWALSNITAYAAVRMIGNLGNDPITQATLAEALLLFSDALSVIAAIYLIPLMRFVEQRQGDSLIPVCIQSAA